MLQLDVYYLCIKVIDSETVRDRATFLPFRKKKEKKTLARKNKLKICSGTKEEKERCVMEKKKGIITLYLHPITI